MSALQQNRQTYQKAHIPSVTLPLRYGNVSNVEYLDAHRLKELKRSTDKKKQQKNLEKIKELEIYYSMRRKSITTNDSPRRKLDISMVSVLFPDNQDSAVENAKKDAKKKKYFLKKVSEKRKLDFTESTVKPDDKYVVQKRNRIKSVFSTIITIVIVFVMLSTVLIRQAEISNQTYLNSQTEKKIEDLKIDLSKLNMDKALKEDLTSVQYAAASKGMSIPDTAQVIYMSVNPELPDKYEEQQSDQDDTSAEVTSKNTYENDNIFSNIFISGSANGPIEVLNSFFDRIGNTLQGWFD